MSFQQGTRTQTGRPIITIQANNTLLFVYSKSTHLTLCISYMSLNSKLHQLCRIKLQFSDTSMLKNFIFLAPGTKQEFVTYFIRLNIQLLISYILVSLLDSDQKSLHREQNK